MDISWYRQKIMHVKKYSSPTWHARVCNMRPAQVIAVYNNFKERGLFKTKKEEKHEDKYYQYTIWDYMEDDLK